MKVKKLEILQRRYEALGVRVEQHVVDMVGYLIGTTFRCNECGCQFSLDAKRARNRHRCPNNCNKGLPLGKKVVVT
jgi:hypothetical protein